jgi:hypothetical protein
MEVHKPKAAHNWREFAIEIGTIVIGVLIALAAEQVAEAVHDRHAAEQARRNIRAEALLDVGFVKGRADAEACTDRRLDELAVLLARAGDGPLQPRPNWVGHPPTGPMFTGRWVSATASGRNSLFPPEEQAQFAELYGLFMRLDEHQQREQAAWAHLRALETWNGPLGPAARIAFAQALQDARYEEWDLKYAGGFALKAAASMGLKAPADGDDATSAICMPMTTPRADALAKLKAPFGEP